MKCVLDMDARSLSFAKNNEPPIVGFTDLPGELVPCCVFYSPKRIVELISVCEIGGQPAAVEASEHPAGGAGIERILSQGLFSGGLVENSGDDESKADQPAGTPKFLSDFVDAVPGSAARRLVNWLEASDLESAVDSSGRGLDASLVAARDGSTIATAAGAAQIWAELDAAGHDAVRAVFAAVLLHHGLVEVCAAARNVCI